MGRFLVPGHQIGHHQPFLVHAVQRDIDGRQRLHPLQHGAVRGVVTTEAQKVQAAGGNGFIAVLGFGMYDDGPAFRPVVIAAEEGGAVFIPGANGGAAKVAGLHIAFYFAEATGQKAHQIICHFAVAGSAALRKKVIKAVIPGVFHGIQSLFQLFNAVCRGNQGSEQPPAAGNKKNQQCDNDAKNPF